MTNKFYPNKCFSRMPSHTLSVPVVKSSEGAYFRRAKAQERGAYMFASRSVCPHQRRRHSRINA